MRRFVYILVLICMQLSSSAQKGIDQLILAEKNFAGYSVAHSTKGAFLKFLDSAGVVFDKAKAVNGIELWNSREKRPGILNWYPLYAEISSSGDFGYTTGPWTYQASGNDSIAARGIYTTVWHIDKNGEWKFLVDLGTNNSPAHSGDEDRKIIIVQKDTGASKSKKDFIAAEESFIKLAGTDKIKAYEKYLSSFYSILNRNDHSPTSNRSAKKDIIDATPSAIIYQVDGWKISPKNDLAYIYGTTELNGIQENYLRIWRHEKDGWKIALEVLRY